MGTGRRNHLHHVPPRVSLHTSHIGGDSGSTARQVKILLFTSCQFEIEMTKKQETPPPPPAPKKEEKL